MKKFLLGVVASTFMFGVSVAKVDIVSIDSVEIMQKSKEGKTLADEIKKKITDYQDFVQGAQKDIASLEKEVKDKADILSKDALETKKKSLEDKKKDFAGQIARKEEALRVEIQSKQVQLRDKQLAVASKMFQDKKWGVMIDKNTPGVLFVSQAIDKTKEVLSKIDADYDTAPTRVAKADSKKKSSWKRGNKKGA